MATTARLLAVPTTSRAAEAKRRKPDILFIITDDQNLDTFGFLRKKALTPHIDRLRLGAR